MVRGICIAVGLAFVGCSGGVPAPDAGAEPDSGIVSCAGDARVQPYAAGMAVSDPAGDRQYVLVSAQPAPPARGTNTWTVKVLDASGQPMTDLHLDAAAFMPDHGHGSDVVPQVGANGDGTYSVGPLYFFMPGVWRVTLSDADGGTAAQSGVFFLCVEG